MRNLKKILVFLSTFIFTLTFGMSCSRRDGSFSSSDAGGSGGSSGPGSSGPTEPFPHLGTSSTFVILAGTSFRNVGTTVIYGNLGVSPGSELMGMSTLRLTGGEVHQNDAVAVQAQVDAGVAYQNLASAPCTTDLGLQNLGGMSLAAGTYCLKSPARLTGVLTLDARGEHNANFHFKVDGDLVIDPGASVKIVNQGATCNVYWQVSGSSVLGVAADFVGTLIGQGAITLESGAKVNGKVVSRNGLISINSNELYNNTCPWPNSSGLQID